MEWKEATFEEDYQEAVAAIEANSQYGRLPSREKKYMTAAEMGKLLGLKRQGAIGFFIRITLNGKKLWESFV